MIERSAGTPPSDCCKTILQLRSGPEAAVRGEVTGERVVAGAGDVTCFRVERLDVTCIALRCPSIEDAPRGVRRFLQYVAGIHEHLRAWPRRELGRNDRRCLGRHGQTLHLSMP